VASLRRNRTGRSSHSLLVVGTMLVHCLKSRIKGFGVSPRWIEHPGNWLPLKLNLLAGARNSDYSLCTHQR
jgi:hypothetical protein